MASTVVQNKIADWLTATALPKFFDQVFAKGIVKLETGGEHRFAVVSSDKKIVGTITTSKATTTSGKLGVGKLSKVRADLFFLLMAEAENKILVVTDKSMFEMLRKEQEDKKRIPMSIYLHFEDLPSDLRTELEAAQEEAANEVGG